MKDDAVAPVVAAMLVLAVIVTIFSAWNAIYLPSLKQQSEMVQDQDVKLAFSRFSSDLVAAASFKRDAILTEPLPLGGGGVIMSPLTSAGTLRVSTEPRQLYNITVRTGGSDLPPVDGRLVNFSYRPVSDFWIDQGYAWHYGYVNVTKGTLDSGADRAVLSTPLEYATIDQLNKSGSIAKLAEILVTVDDSEPWYNSSENVSRIALSSVTFSAEPGRSYTSGNGVGTLMLNATVEDPYDEYNFGRVNGVPDTITLYVNRVDPEVFPRALYRRCDKSFAGLAQRYPGNIIHTNGSTEAFKWTRIASVPESLPFDVTYRQVVVNVSVH